MKVQIGRFGLDPVVTDAATAARSDGGLTITGVVDASSLSDLQTMRAQFYALSGNIDEPVVPVIVDGASNEYWAVRSVSWNEEAGAYDGLYQASWSIDLASISSRSGVLLESRMLFAQVTGSSGVPAANPWTAVVASAQAWATSQSGVTAVTRAASTGGVLVFSGANLKDASAAWRQSPTDAYVGAATIQAGPSGLGVDQVPSPGAGAGWWR